MPEVARRVTAATSHQNAEERTISADRTKQSEHAQQLLMLSETPKNALITLPLNAKTSKLFKNTKHATTS
jgi:hypothetical protein